MQLTLTLSLTTSPNPNPTSNPNLNPNPNPNPNPYPLHPNPNLNPSSGVPASIAQLLRDPAAAPPRRSRSARARNISLPVRFVPPGCVATPG